MSISKNTPNLVRIKTINTRKLTPATSNPLCTRLLTAVAVSSALLFGPIAVQAAEKGKGLVEEVIVTATYRDTNLMDTPVSISAVTAEIVENLGAQSMEELFTMVPGLNMVGSSNGQSRYTIRGITSQSGSDGANPTGATVGIYLDSTPVTAALGPDNQVSGTLFDIDRVEVLKGPQGTLFGEGSQGGTIRFLYKQPDSTGFDAAANASVATMSESDDTSKRLDAMINIPMGDRLALRATGWASEVAGFIDNLRPDEPDFNTQESTGVRVALRYESDSVSVTGSIHHTVQRTEGGSGTFEPYKADNRRQAGFPPESEDAIDLFSLEVVADFDWATLTSVTSYTDREISAINESSASGAFFIDIFYGGSTLAADHPDCVPEKTFFLCPGWPGIFNLADPANPIVTPDGQNLEANTNFANLYSKRWVQELRLVSSGDQRLRWTAGAFWKDSEDQTSGTNRASFFPGRDLFAALLTPLLSGNPANHHTDFLEEYAVFGEISYDLTDTLEITAGARVSNLKQFFSIAQADTDDTTVSPKLVLSWHAMEDLLLYASYASGFRPGNVNNVLEFQANNFDALGLTDRAALARSALFYDGDKLHSYELGLKTTLWDGRVALLSSIYYIDWQDMISSEQDVAIAEGNVYNVNSGGAEIKGFELEVRAFVTDNLNIRLTGDYNDSEVTSAGPFVRSAKGNSLIYSPKHSLSAAIAYSMPLAEGWELNFYLDRAWVAKQFSESDNTQVIPSYQRSNGRITLRSPDQKWRVALYGTNLENDEILRGRTLTGTQYWHSPRQFGLEVGYKL